MAIGIGEGIPLESFPFKSNVGIGLYTVEDAVNEGMSYFRPQAPPSAFEDLKSVLDKFTLLIVLGFGLSMVSKMIR